MTEVPSSECLKRTTTGLEPCLAAALAYVIGWVSGAVFYLLERDNRYVRFHAMQAMLGFGAIFVDVALWGVAFGSLLFSATAFKLFVQIAQVVWLLSLVPWLVCLYKAYVGQAWKLPIAGEIAARLVEN